MGTLINIDNGGTLTDFCAFDGDRLLFTKTLTTPHDLSACFFEGLGRLARLFYGDEDVARLLQDTDYIRYSTTQGTNALVQRRGPRIGLVVSSTAAGASLGGDTEQTALFAAVVGARVHAIDPALDDAALDGALTRALNDLGARGANRIVVSLDVANVDAAERRCERIVLRRYPSQLLGALPVAFAGQMSRDANYARRTWSALFNAFLHPAMERFLYGAEHRLKQHRTRNPLLIYRNDGGSARIAKTIALKTYSSGPRGGMDGARALARHYSFEKLLSIDIGGTTTDVGVVENGELHQHAHGQVEGVAVSIPLCAIHSEGVGGSSVIRVVGEALQVGPQSVGAVPGPACFSRGGTDLTMTDVALLNGLIDPVTYFGGELALDTKAAASALLRNVAEPLQMTAEAALNVAEAAWVAQVVIGIRRLTGDVADHMLAGIGGGGPLILTSIAEALDLTRAIIPGMAPVFSAYGIGFSPLSQHYQVHLAHADVLSAARVELLERARRDLFAEGTTLEACVLEWTVIGNDGDGEAVTWVSDTAAPLHLEAPLILRLEAAKPVQRQSMKALRGSAPYPAETPLTRRLHYRGESIGMPLYRFRDLKPGANGAGPCIIEDDFFTARIDRDWRFHLSENRDLLLER